MTNPVRDLLDQAVADLRPANSDPVAAVRRRGRMAFRRRTLTAGALAAATIRPLRSSP